LVSNGTKPDMIERLIDHQPTNLYISFYGTTPEMYRKTAVPMVNDFWEKVLESMHMLDRFDCNTVIRLTLSKGLNFSDPKGYAEIIEKTGAKFVECKAFMAVGGSRRVMKYEDMPLHDEIKEFAEQIEKHSSYRIINDKKDSRVVLLSREGKKFVGID
ncbi:MAG: 4-demethylwyosine synthase TYW1, partial [Candidatus Aenigmarchaeota archaeon]|nr:4-demethylwyosine synthase TYW1 [Candidatus Aenigmarchaeota archaeon]